MAKKPPRSAIHAAWLKDQTGDIWEFGQTLKPGGKAFEKFYKHITSGKDLIELQPAFEWMDASEKEILANRLSHAHKEIKSDKLRQGLLEPVEEKGTVRKRPGWAPSNETVDYVPSGNEVAVQQDGTQIVRTRLEPETPGRRPTGLLPPGTRAHLSPELTSIVDMTAEQKASVVKADKEFKEWKERNPDQTPKGKTRRRATPEVQEAYDILRYREAHPERFYENADLDAWRSLYDASRERAVSNYGMTRWNENFDFLEATQDWNRVINNIAETMPEGESSDFLRQHKIDRGHINPKGVKGWAHQRDVDANISWENRSGNRASYAETTFKDFVDYMERSQAGDKPFMRLGEADKIQALIDNPNLTPDQIARIKSIQAYTNNLPELTSNIPPELGQYLDVPMFDSKGQFSSRGTLSNLGYSTEQMESIRRLGITMMDQNPEFDLDLFMETSNDDWLKGGTKDQVGWKKVAEGNRLGSKQNSKPIDVRSRARILALAKKAGGGTLGLASLLAYSGASYGAQPDWSEDDYLDHIMKTLEIYDDNVVQPGRDTIMNAADFFGAGDYMRQFDDYMNNQLEQTEGGWTNIGANFAYGMAKDFVPETVGAVKGTWDLIDPNSPTNLGTQLYNWLNNPQDNGQGSAPNETPYYDFGGHAVPMPQVEPVSNTVPMPQVEQISKVVPMPSVNQLPENVVPYFQSSHPSQKYGGVLQREW